MGKYIETIEEWREYTKEITEWQEEIKKAFENVIINVLRNSYPYIIDIAKFKFMDYHSKLDFLPLSVVFFMKPEYINKNHVKLDKEIKTLLEMMLLDKREINVTGEILDLEVKVFVVESE